MPEAAQLSDAKRALLQKYLQGGVSPAITRPASIPRRTCRTRAPLSFGQQQLWFLAQLVPEVPVYNEPITVTMPQPVDVEALHRALTEIVRRHEAWRTTFPVVDGEPVQHIHPPDRYAFSTVDLRSLPEGDRSGEALRLATREARRPFDLAEGPLVRAMVVRLSDADCRLFITLHHIIMDGVTIYNVLLPELIALYEAFSAGKPSPLPELSTQYGDYAEWQRHSFTEEVLSAQTGYWRRQLSDPPPGLELPTDRPRPPIQLFRGAQIPFALSATLTQRLRDLGRHEGVTLFMVLLAAFQTLLYRYSGQEDLLVGTATAGRKRSELEGLLGYFLNPLVLRTDLTGNPTFRELLARVRAVTLEAYAHDDVPFDRLVRELHPDRDPSRNPFIQVMCNMEPPLPSLPVGWGVSQMDVDTGTAKRDLYLELDDRPQGVIGRLQYNSDLFDAGTIARMLGHWQTILDHVAADPAQRVADVSLWTEAERRALIPDPSIPLSRLTHEPVMRSIVSWAGHLPQAPAISQSGRSWSYETLVHDSSSIAQALLMRNFWRGEVVAVSGQRSYGLVASIVGVVMAGGVLLALDGALPSARQKAMLELAGVKRLLFVGRRRQEDAWLDAAVEVIEVEPETAHVRVAADGMSHQAVPLPAISSDDAAYVFFTSGTTGVPKAVLGQHAGLSQFLAWERETCAVGPGDHVAQLTGLSFDVVLRDIFLPLTSGATLCLPDDDYDLSGSWVMRWLEREKVSLLHTVPSLAQSWMSDDPPRVSLRALRWVLFAGEPLRDGLIQAWRAAYPEAGEIGNLYGPTETTLAKCFYHVPRNPTPGIQPVGWPLPQTQALILTATGQLCGPGETGEIALRTPFRSLGYLNSPAETCKRFIKNPFRDDEEDLLYFTGDRGRYSLDGALEFLGRQDNQVKIRGMRVELAEVETTLERHPGVCQAVVLVQERRPGELRLVAYIVPHKGQIVTVAELRRFLRETLPAHMVPGALLVLDTLPLTPNGKVNRRSLLTDFPPDLDNTIDRQPSPAHAEDGRKHRYMPPTLTLHHQLVKIWEDLLDVRPIGIQDDFFELGGHSLLAVRLLTEIERACGKRIPLPALFVDATITHLTRILLEEDSTEPATTLAQLQAGDSRPPFFFLHGDLEGGGYYCLNLARSLGADQPFYVLHPHGVAGEGDLRLPQTIEAMATEFMNMVRAEKPHGPYVLGGFCNGGVVAFEIARQLQADGEEVQSLLLIDSSPVEVRRVKFLRNFIGQIGGLAGLGAEEQLSYFLRLRHYGACVRNLSPFAIAWRFGMNSAAVRRTLCRFGRLFADRTTVFAQGSSSPTSAPVAAHDLERDVVGMYRWIKSRYNPRKYAGRITLFLSDEEHRDHQGNPTLGWDKLSDGVEVRILPGAHLTCITDHVQVLANQMRLCIDAAKDA